MLFRSISLPVRLAWGVVSFISIGRLLTLGLLGAAGYALWRLVSDDEAPAPVAPPIDPVNVVAPAQSQATATASST